jgi:hypothetical protein
VDFVSLAAEVASPCLTAPSNRLAGIEVNAAGVDLAFYDVSRCHCRYSFVFGLYVSAVFLS